MSDDPKQNDLPSFDPQGTESITEIPERFLVGGILSLDKVGRWFFRGEPIEHPGLCLFLARQLRRTKEGGYWVVNGPQRATVEVEETPFFVTLIEVDQAKGVIKARLNDKSEELLSPEGFFRGEDEVVYTQVKFEQAGALSGTGHRARILRSAIMGLEPFLTELPDGGIGMALGGHTYPIPQRSLTEREA